MWGRTLETTEAGLLKESSNRFIIRQAGPLLATIVYRSNEELCHGLHFPLRRSYTVTGGQR